METEMTYVTFTDQDGLGDFAKADAVIIDGVRFVRERVEPCLYCLREEAEPLVSQSIFDWDRMETKPERLVAVVQDGGLTVEDDHYHEWMQIRFCPMCGRSLAKGE